MATETRESFPVDETLVRELLAQREGETLDFKATGYDLMSDNGRYALIKDVLAMANTPREQTAHIILGAKKLPDGEVELWGVSEHPDDDILQSQFAERTYPVPRLTYSVVQLDGKELGVISVAADRVGPFMPLKDFGNALRQRQVYFRRGSTNDLAMPEDLRRIVAWISGGDHVQPVTAPLAGVDAWGTVLALTDNFDPAHALTLVTDRIDAHVYDAGVIGLAPWAFVVDLDQRSDADGLLSAARPALEERRALHLVVRGNRAAFNINRGTYWFFARGLLGRESTLSLGPWREWQSVYGTELRAQFEALARATLPRTMVFLITWYDATLIDHLQSVLESALATFGDRARFLLLTTHPADLHIVAAKFDAEIATMPYDHFLSGLKQQFAHAGIADVENIILPSASGAPVSLGGEERHWIEEEIELIHAGTGTVAPSDREIGTAFLKGAQIDWYDVALHYDVDRDITSRLQRVIAADLGDGSRNTGIRLYHRPGAGGTTVSRRIAWDLHRQYPTGLLHRCEPRETIQRVFRIVSLTRMPMLLVVDGAEVSERAIDEFFEQAHAQRVAVVVLQVLRRFSDQSESRRVFNLPSVLTDGESAHFAHVLTREAPRSGPALQRLLSTARPETRNPFYFCLQAFENDFTGLERYVETRLETLTELQLRVLIYLSMAHHYAQQPLPSESFRELLGIPPSRRVRLIDALPSAALDLLVSTGDETWRTAHDLVAVEVLRQALTPPGRDRATWKQQLSTYAIAFAEFARGDPPVPSTELLEVVRRAFVYRDNREILGTERSGARQFAHLLEDIPVREGRLRSLETLVRLYDDEAHFWAHLGRFYAIEMHDFAKSIDAIDHAIALQDDDHVLYHMRGMAIRYQVYELIRQRSTLEEVITQADRASDAFAQARQRNPDEEYAYISEVQMLARVLDYGGSVTSGGVVGFLVAPSTPASFKSSFERAEDLLEHVRRNRQGDTSSYERDCRAQLDALYGNHSSALQTWDNLLARIDIYAPPIRRQMAWTYLARKGRDWDALEPRDIERIARLMEENLKEEPYDERSLRLWLNAIRKIASPPSLDAVIERVAYWKANADTLDAAYYLYVLYTLQSLDGSMLGTDHARRNLEEVRGRARFRRNRDQSYEWVGKGQGMRQLVHHSRLGDWDQQTRFWSNVAPLERLNGRIARISGPQAGQIELANGLTAFFVPAAGEFREGHENRAVSFYLGFSYDGPRAWEVRGE